MLGAPSGESIGTARIVDQRRFGGMFRRGRRVTKKLCGGAFPWGAWLEAFSEQGEPRGLAVDRRFRATPSPLRFFLRSVRIEMRSPFPPAAQLRKHLIPYRLSSSPQRRAVIRR